MSKLSILAPAKINLTLDISHKREDGYHEIKTIMMPIDLFDEVFIEKNNDNKILVKTNKKNLPQNEKNICYDASKIFFKNNNIDDYGISIYINKKIPSKAGLAGGSTDAAATLILLNEMYNTKLSTLKLEKLGEKIGSDVPFCVRKKTALATGRGEKLTNIKTTIDFYIVLVKPNVSSSTKLAYENFAKLKSEKKYKNHDLNNALEALRNNNVSGISNNLYNIFEKIINIKEIEVIKKKLNLLNSNGISMSGSGTTVFGIFKKKRDALKAYEVLKKEKNYMVFMQKPFYNK